MKFSAIISIHGHCSEYRWTRARLTTLRTRNRPRRKRRNYPPLNHLKPRKRTRISTHLRLRANDAVLEEPRSSRKTTFHRTDHREKSHTTKNQSPRHKHSRDPTHARPLTTPKLNRRSLHTARLENSIPPKTDVVSVVPQKIQFFRENNCSCVLLCYTAQPRTITLPYCPLSAVARAPLRPPS